MGSRRESPGGVRGIVARGAGVMCTLCSVRGCAADGVRLVSLLRGSCEVSAGEGTLCSVRVLVDRESTRRRSSCEREAMQAGRCSLSESVYEGARAWSLMNCVRSVMRWDRESKEGSVVVSA